MKTIQFSIDLRSFFLGALTIIGVLLLANFKSDDPKQPNQENSENRRYQAVTSGRESIILDTRTGEFVVLPDYLNKPRTWKLDFKTIQGKKLE